MALDALQLPPHWPRWARAQPPAHALSIGRRNADAVGILRLGTRADALIAPRHMALDALQLAAAGGTQTPLAFSVWAPGQTH